MAQPEHRKAQAVKFSVVTISFNQACFLKQALDSVLQQDYPDFEYIVVDPGSTDSSRDLILSYREQIDHILFEADDGPADGLNKGFAQADGEIFCFVNSDDYLLPGALSKAAQYFASHPHVDVLSGNAWVVDGTGACINRFHSRRFSLWMCAYGAATLAQQSTFFRAGPFQKLGGFNTKNRVAWDGELWIDLALAGARFARTPDYLSAFRVYGSSITGSGRLREAYERYTSDMFQKIMGRSPAPRDRYFRISAKALEYLTQPVIFKDRLRLGPTTPRTDEHSGS